MNAVAKHLFTTGDDRPEKRGGARQSDEQKEIRESMVAFIKTFKVQRSHYGRAKSKRQYLPCYLNIRCMFKMWLKQREEQNLPASKKNEGTFYDIFYSKFNLAFGCPRTDVCSRCELLKHNRTIGSEEDKRTANLEYQLHRAKAKRFYSLCREEMQRRDTLTLVFDLQQTLPFPKTNISEAFYRRQGWVYNLGIVMHGSSKLRRNCFMYTWDESQSGRGSNEICSAIMNFLRKISTTVRRRRYSRLCLISDGCSGQNKNSSMITMLLKYVNLTQNPFEEIVYVFPIPGHSRMAPDRLFGRIEKQLRRREVILTPDDYRSILQKHGTVYTYTRNYNIFDYKKLADAVLKKNNKLGIRAHRMWRFKKGSKIFEHKNAYFGTYTEEKNLVKVSNLRGRKPLLVEANNHISALKAEDMRFLLEHLTMDDETRTYFDRILATATSSKPDALEFPDVTR